jgi:hypothetical protein
MARSITLTLGAGLGADLGPNFNLTADVGSVTPSTATKSELLAGKSVSVDDLATQVTVTSTGTCTNAITQTIPCTIQTSTTTSTSTSTTSTSTTSTTTSATNCYCYTMTDDPNNVPNDLYLRYRSCFNGTVIDSLVNSLLQTDNGNGTYTYHVCVDQSGTYNVPVCVQNNMEIFCPTSAWITTSTPCSNDGDCQ